jgi:hypothetical protein
MVMGLVLPFVLAFVAIPLEVVIYSLRTAVGVLLVMLNKALGFGLRFIAMIFLPGRVHSGGRVRHCHRAAPASRALGRGPSPPAGGSG